MSEANMISHKFQKILTMFQTITRIYEEFSKIISLVRPAISSPLMCPKKKGVELYELAARLDVKPSRAKLN